MTRRRGYQREHVVGYDVALERGKVGKVCLGVSQRMAGVGEAMPGVWGGVVVMPVVEAVVVEKRPAHQRALVAPDAKLSHQSQAKVGHGSNVLERGCLAVLHVAGHERHTRRRKRGRRKLLVTLAYLFWGRIHRCLLNPENRLISNFGNKYTIRSMRCTRTASRRSREVTYMGVQSKGHIDLRVKRSQAAIRSAVVSLLFEKPTQDITAKDVAERALINKKTFYAHYPSVRAVLQEIENDAVSEVSGIVESGDVSTPSGLSKVLAQLKTLSTNNGSAFGALARTPARMLLSERLRRELSGHLGGLSAVSSQLSASLSSRVSCAVDFAAGGIVSLLASWLFGERVMSEDELSQTVIQSVRSCLGAMRSMATAPTGDTNCA